jgi:hypothetical protein
MNHQIPVYKKGGGGVELRVGDQEAQYFFFIIAYIFFCNMAYSRRRSPHHNVVIPVDVICPQSPFKQSDRAWLAMLPYFSIQQLTTALLASVDDFLTP